MSIGWRLFNKVRIFIILALLTISFYFVSRTLAQHCPNIEYLDLSECKKVTDVSIESLSRHCIKLLSLNVCSCSNITDNSLKFISDGCSVSNSNRLIVEFTITYFSHTYCSNQIYYKYKFKFLFKYFSFLLCFLCEQIPFVRCLSVAVFLLADLFEGLNVLRSLWNYPR